MKNEQRTTRILTMLQASAILPLALVAVNSRAQSYGSIVGTVTDQTSASVPGAGVILTNIATGEKRTEKTNSEGTYRILNLIPGIYREDVEITGFKHVIREPLKVDVESTLRVDVPLTIGAVTEVVQVSTETPLLQTESATLQTVVSEKTVQEMPLNGRNVENLIALTPGVVAQGGTSGTAGSNQSAGHTNPTGWNNYQIGGGQPGQAAQFLDGAPTTGLGGNTVFLIPVQDSVGEFRVASAAVSPEFGRFGGGVVNFNSKSGANAFHGSAYEYFRNKVLNAATYFGKLNHTSKAGFNLNQYGGTLGGPILRDKLQFFVNYEGTKVIQGSTYTALIPTVAERNGDFSADGAIYDPFSTVVTNGAITSRTQFAGSQIPQARWNSTANYIVNGLKYWPVPNTTAGGSVYNYATTVAPGETSQQGGVRVDYNVSQKQHMFGRYTRWQSNDIGLNEFFNQTAGAGAVITAHQGVIGDTYSFTPKLTGDIRLSYGRGIDNESPPATGFDISQFGPGYASLASQVTAKMLVNIGLPQQYALFQGMTQLTRNFRDVYALTPSVTYILGQHSLKFGADIRFLDLTAFSAQNGSGTFSFDTSFTSSNGSTNGAGGNAIASLLLGTPASGSIATGQSVGEYSWYQAYYVSDNWQASRNVAVNIGLRYDLPGAWYERQQRATVLLPNAANALGTVGGYALKGGLFLVNSANWSAPSTEEVKHDLFSPRIGVSYNPVKDTVVRAGYSLVYLPFDSSTGAAPSGSPINVATTTMVPSVAGANQVPLNTLSDPFPAGGVAGTVQQSILEPVGRSQAYINALTGLSISGPVPQIRFPYDQQWTASVQQQFAGSSMLQIAYAGNRGTFLPLGSNLNLNQLPDQYDSMGSALTKTTPNPFAGVLNPTGSLNGANISAGQLLRPFPEYSSFTRTNAKGDSIYHAMLVTFQKRFAAGGLVNVNYTWAKIISNVLGTPLTQLEGAGQGAQTIPGPQDWTNLRSARSILDTDIRNRFVASFVSPLPFGKGHMFFAGSSEVAGGFVNGWQVNGIITFQSGYPLSFVTNGGNTLSKTWGAGTILANYVPSATGCNAVKTRSGSAQSRLSGWFNTACFAAAPDYTFGNEPRVDGSVHGAGIANYDVSLSKETGLFESVKLQLKVEGFNIFNRVQFNTPNTSVGNGSFGTVTSTANQPRLLQLSGRFLF